MELKSLFAAVSEHQPTEEFLRLIDERRVRIERIVSHGHATPPGEWYDQPHAEFVVLLKGAARLRLAGDTEEIELRSGDSLYLLAHQKHRVEWTTSAEPTVWLAVHWSETEDLTDESLLVRDGP